MGRTRVESRKEFLFSGAGISRGWRLLLLGRWERRELLLAGVGGGTGVTIASAGYGGLGITADKRP